MQAFADNTFADTGASVSSTCNGARTEAARAMTANGTITSRSMGSCKKSPDPNEGYIVRWAVTGYTWSHSDADHSHSGSSNAQSGSAKSFTKF